MHKKTSVIRVGFIVFSFLLLSWGVRAAPVIEGSSIADGNGNQNVTIRVVTWDANTESGLNPCYGSDACSIGPDVEYSSGVMPTMYGYCGGHNFCLNPSDDPDLKNYRTLKEVAQRWTARGLDREVTMPITGSVTGCVRMYVLTRTVTAPLAGSICTPLPPVLIWCSVSDESADFGDRMSAALDNITMQVKPQVTCRGGNGRVRLAPVDSNIQLGDASLTASIAVDTPGLVNARQNVATSIPLTVTLHTHGHVPPGPHAGTFVMVVNYH